MKVKLSSIPEVHEAIIQLKHFDFSWNKRDVIPKRARFTS
jgi:hypothetical protein